MTGRPIIKLDSKSEFVIGLLAPNAWMKFKADRSRDKLDTLQWFYQISSRILISQTRERKDKYNNSQAVQINLNFGANICNLQSLKLFSFPLLFWNWCPQLSSLLAPNSRKYVCTVFLMNGEWTCLIFDSTHYILTVFPWMVSSIELFPSLNTFHKKNSIFENNQLIAKILGHKIMRNLHLTFDCVYCSQK